MYDQCVVSFCSQVTVANFTFFSSNLKAQGKIIFDIDMFIYHMEKSVVPVTNIRNGKNLQECGMQTKGKVQNKKIHKKLTNVSFMYVCVGRKWSNVSFFSPNNDLIDNSLSE